MRETAGRSRSRGAHEPPSRVLDGLDADALARRRLARFRTDNDIPRRPDGRPDLSGNYDTGTLTPIQRRPEIGDRKAFTAAEAEQMERAIAAWAAADAKPGDPNR